MSDMLISDIIPFLLVCLLILLAYLRSQAPPERPDSVRATAKQIPARSRWWTLEEQEHLRKARECREQSTSFYGLQNRIPTELIALEERYIREKMNEKRIILLSGTSLPQHGKWKTCLCRKCVLVREKESRLRICAISIIERQRILRNLRRRNGEQPPCDVLDLHYLHEAEAVAYVTNVMEEYRNDVGRKIGIITGKGKHSENGPKIKNAVEAILNRLGYSKTNGGYRYARTPNGYINDGKLIVTIR